MTGVLTQQENLTTRQRWFSLAKFVVGAAIVIAHNVYRIIPNEVPILFVLGWIYIRLRDGGWNALGSDLFIQLDQRPGAVLRPEPSQLG